jgi:hypothetical protein
MFLFPRHTIGVPIVGHSRGSFHGYEPPRLISRPWSRTQAGGRAGAAGGGGHDLLRVVNDEHREDEAADLDAGRAVIRSFGAVVAYDLLLSPFRLF